MLARNFMNQFKNLKKFSSPYNKLFSSSLHNSKDHEQNRSKVPSNPWMTDKDSDFKVTVKENHLQFSKTPILENYGELPYGEIPEALKFIRPFEMTTLDNGIRVCTERWNTPLCAVGAFIDAGSRYETLETSGTAHFLEHLLFKGTKNRLLFIYIEQKVNLNLKLKIWDLHLMLILVENILCSICNVFHKM